jgi:hypothetical protein
LARDAAGNSAVGFGLDETVEAINEYDAGPIRVICLSVAMALPVEGDDEDTVTTVDVEVPAQPAEDDDEDGDEAEEVHAPSEQPARAEVAA